MPRLRLINPNSPLTTITLPQVIGKMTLGRRALFMPVNLAICAAVVPEGWDVEIVDENVLGAPVAASADGDAVGVGAMTTQARRAYEIADEYRRLGVRTYADTPRDTAVAVRFGAEGIGLTLEEPSPGGMAGQPLEEVEKQHIARTLELVGGNREKAAELLGGNLPEFFIAYMLGKSFVGMRAEDVLISARFL